MTDYERIDQLESDVKHLTRVLRDLMHEVKRNADAIADLHAKRKDQEWEARFDFLHKPESDRLATTVSKVRRQTAENRRTVQDSQ